MAIKKKEPAPGLIRIVIEAEMDTGYVKAVGDNVRSSALTFAQHVEETVMHEDFGSLLEARRITAHLTIGQRSPQLLLSRNTDTD